MDLFTHLRHCRRRLVLGPRGGRLQSRRRDLLPHRHTADDDDRPAARQPGCAFDVDEHTGGFGGVKRYFEGPDAPADVAGVLIGYPGLDHVVGSRGVHRVKLYIHGVASHSGGRANTSNAVVKAAHLIRDLDNAGVPVTRTLTSRCKGS